MLVGIIAVAIAAAVVLFGDTITTAVSTMRDKVAAIPIPGADP